MRYIDADELLDLWDELVLPPAVRQAWAKLGPVSQAPADCSGRER